MNNIIKSMLVFTLALVIDKNWAEFKITIILFFPQFITINKKNFINLQNLLMYYQL